VLLPLGDAPNPRGVAIVTYLLIAANVAVYALVTLPLGAQPASPLDPATIEYVRAIAPRVRLDSAQLLARTTAYDLFVFAHGFRPAAPQALDLLTSLFLHAGFLHLFGNMLFLWIYGDNVEHRLGRGWFLLAYLGTGVAATLFHTLFAARSPLPLIGASGAISGVLGCYFVWFPANRVRLLVLIVPLFMQVVQVSARLVLGMYLVLDNVLPFLVARGAEAGIAHGAHIGGFVAGVALAWVIDRGELRVRPPEYADVEPPPGDTTAAALRDLVEGGRFAEAAQIYFSLGERAARAALGPVELLALGDWLHRNGHPDAALVVYRRRLRDHPPGPGTAAAHLGAGLVELEENGQPAQAYQHLRAALAADPSPAVAAQARRAIAAIAALQKRRVGHERGGL
jgi:membrane associated rhomboid family serine protease